MTFDSYRAGAYPFRFAGTLHVGMILGGVPSDPKVAEGYIKTKLGLDSEQLIQQAVAQMMVDRGITTDEAVVLVNDARSLNGFKRDEHGLYIEGRQLKAALKEACSVAVAAGKIPPDKYGKTRKNALGYLAEHVFVLQERLHLGAFEPTGIIQRFVHTWRGDSIKYEEYVEDAKIDFTVEADEDYPESFWANVWLCGERQGIGATRSMGYGTYTVTRWDRI